MTIKFFLKVKIDHDGLFLLEILWRTIGGTGTAKMLKSGTGAEREIFISEFIARIR